MAKKNRSGWKIIFQITGLLLVIGGGVFAYLLFRTNATQADVREQNTQIQSLQQQIDSIEEEPGYNKIDLVRDLIEGSEMLPRSEHIPKVIEMLQGIQAVDTSSKDRIELSDFRVSLDEIELKGSVSRLILLYYTSEERGFTGLIDRFKELEFIDDIRIQTYEKSEGKGYEFTLNAKVIIN